MSHRFNLIPDAELLFTLGYIDATEKQFMLLNRIVEFEAQDVWNEEKRTTIETSFNQLADKFGLNDYRDTLLFIALKENDRAAELFEIEHNTYEQRLRDKQLAQLLLLYRPSNKFKPDSIKVTTATDSLTIKSADIIEWVGVLLGQVISRGEFTPGIHGPSLFQFMGVNDDSNEEGLNYYAIEEISNTVIKKPNVRTRNKYLAPFLLKLYAVLNRHTPLVASPGTRFSDSQLNFLFGVGEAFEWFDEESTDSEPKDYIGALLNNYINKYRVL